MKFHSLRSSLVGSLFVLLASVLLGSCGGGGAASADPSAATSACSRRSGHVLRRRRRTRSRSPAAAALHRSSSSEPGMLPVPDDPQRQLLHRHPEQPRRDRHRPAAGRAAGAHRRPSRCATRSATPLRPPASRSRRTSSPATASRFVSNCAGAPDRDRRAAACARRRDRGRARRRRSTATSSATARYRFEVVRGPFSWSSARPAQGGTIAGNTVTSRTDHEGNAHAIFRVDQQRAPRSSRVIPHDRRRDRRLHRPRLHDQRHPDRRRSSGRSPTSSPSPAPTTAQCGTGTADFLVFDGTPPYTAISSYAERRR